MSIKDTLPDIKPTLLLDFANTKTLDPRITFGRASTATYYDGKTTAKAEENLLTYSQEFDNAAWVKQAASVTANTTIAPDGTTTADSLIENTSNNPHFIYQIIGAGYGAGVNMISCYAKAGSRTKFRLVMNTIPAGAYAEYDLTAGTASSVTLLGSGFSTGSASITSVGNGWYRCMVSITASSALMGQVYLSLLDASGSNTYTGDGTSGLFIWGAQIEQRATVTAYTPTTSAPITNYIPQLMTAPAGGPRFDHNPVTRESLGLLIEEARTNLLLRSEAIDVSAIWAKAGSTIAADASIAPDGALTAKAIVRTTSNNESMVRQSTAQAASTTYTFSVYAKSGSTGALLYLRNIAVDATTGTGVVTFSLDGTNTITANSTYTGKASITPVGNGWYRCSITGTTAATIANNLVDAGCSTNAGLLSGSINASVFIWGAQLEAGAFATSYIPTTTSTVTRQADSASMTGANFSSWYRADEGTFYADVKSQSSGACVEANNGASSDRVAVSFDAANSRMAGVNAISGVYTAIVYSLAGTTPNSASNKGAFAYKENDFALSANASAVSTDTNGQVGKPNQVRLGSSGLGATGEFINGSIRKLAFYPKRLTNPQLQALTA